jgi:hypothetical protein
MFQLLLYYDLGQIPPLNANWKHRNRQGEEKGKGSKMDHFMGAGSSWADGQVKNYNMQMSGIKKKCSFLFISFPQ